MFRSRPKGDTYLCTSDIWIALAVAFFAPLALGLTAGRLPGFGILTMFALSSFFAIFALPVGALIGLRAMRHGWAGWGTAILAGGLAAYAVILLFVVMDDGPAAFARLDSHIASLVVAPVGSTYAGLMWLTLRWRRPAAFSEVLP